MYAAGPSRTLAVKHRRLTTFGDVTSAAEWEGRHRAEAVDGVTDWMDRRVQPVDVERVAASLGIDAETTPTGLRLKVRWDDWRAVAVRRWCKNPTGKQWSDMRIETLIREGVIEADEPPDEAYEQAELVGVAS